jgi:hypothetical protein
MSTSQVDDIQVTYAHRPIKPEPAVPNHRTFADLPQLDGQIDLFPSKSPQRPKSVNNDERLNEVLARIKAKPVHHKKTIELFKLPPLVSRYSSNTTKKKKADSTMSKNSSSTKSYRLDQAPEVKVKEQKPMKKPKPALQSKLLKENECAIRPVFGPPPSKHASTLTPNPPSRVENNSSILKKTSYDSGPKSKSDSITDQRKPYRSASDDVQTASRMNASH